MDVGIQYCTGVCYIVQVFVCFNTLFVPFSLVIYMYTCCKCINAVLKARMSVYLYTWPSFVNCSSFLFFYANLYIVDGLIKHEYCQSWFCGLFLISTLACMIINCLIGKHQVLSREATYTFRILPWNRADKCLCTNRHCLHTEDPITLPMVTDKPNVKAQCSLFTYRDFYNNNISYMSCHLI